MRGEGEGGRCEVVEGEREREKGKEKEVKWRQQGGIRGINGQQEEVWGEDGR